MNVSLQNVREALGELGKFRFGEMRVEDALQEIVHTTHAMFGVDGTGLMLSDAEQQLRSVAASDDRLQHLEEIQIQHSEGPCIAAFEDKELVGVEDLKQDERWPKFSDAALSRAHLVAFPARRNTTALARRFACAPSLRILESAVETPPRL